MKFNNPPAQNPLPLPRLILRLGGLGNRSFGQENGIAESSDALFKQAGKACEEVLQEIEKVMLEIHKDEPPHNGLHHWPEQPSWWKTHALALLFGKTDRWGWEKRCGLPARVFSDVPPLVTVLTGGADGGDSLIRDASLARPAVNGKTVTFEHLRIVPEAPAKVSDGLGIGDPAAKRQDLTAKVEAKKALTREEAHSLAKSVRKRAFAYRAQSEALRHHSDILLAIWDPDTEGKAGGTSESVVVALRERIPVIAIRLVSPESAEIHVLETERQLQALQGHGSGRPNPDWRTVLKQALAWRLCFPDPAPPKPNTPHPLEPASAYQPRTAFAAFREDEPLRSIWTGRFWKAFDAFAKYLASRQAVKDEHDEQKKRALLDVQMKAREAFWKSFKEALIPKFAKVSPMPSMPLGEDGNPPAEDSFEHCYARVRDRASSSGMSGVFGDAHRGGIVASYFFATIAVLLALIGGILHALHMPAVALAVVAFAELGIILLMYALSVCSATEDWNAAYTDTRILAEALGVMRFLGPLGVHTPIPRLPYYLQKSDSVANPDRLWTIWYFRALVRMAPLRLGHDDLKTCWDRLGTLSRIQIDYHQRNASKQQSLHHTIEGIVPKLFALVGVCALMHFLDIIMHWHSTMIFTVSLLCCVGGPALIAALHGFASQIETTRLNLRSSSMVRLLDERSSALQSLDLTTDPDGAETVWGLTTEALTTAALLMDETASWSMLYRDADIHAG